MPRTARVVVPDMALHVRQRGHNRGACFFKDEDFATYLRMLAYFSRQHACTVHAYCLMPNHVHLLVTPRETQSCALMMKSLGQLYTQHVNRAFDRTGSLWEGRFRSCPVSSDRYALACYRYIELNPVRAGMVARAWDYRWSSYHANAEGKSDRLIEPHPAYRAISDYRGLFDSGLEESFVDDIRKATSAGYIAGSVRNRRGRPTGKMGSVPI